MKAKQTLCALIGALLLTQCGESGGVPDTPRPEWNPQPVDSHTVPQPIDTSLPKPKPVDVSIPHPPQDDFDEIAEPTLVIGEKALRFDPSPLYAIFFYEGTFQNYDEAVVTANPVASVPANQNCSARDGRCWKSPLVLSSCDGCDKLDSSKTYSAFLLRKSSEPLHTVLMIPVVFE